MAQPLNLRRISATISYLHSNLKNLQAGHANTGNRQLIFRDGTDYYHHAVQKYWDGAAYQYCDNDFNDVTIRGTVYIQQYMTSRYDSSTNIRFGTDESRISLVEDDTTVITIRDYNAGIKEYSPNSTLHIGGSVAYSVTHPRTNYVCTREDHILLEDTSAAKRTHILPDAKAITGREYVFKKINVGGNDYNISPTLGQTIDNQPLFTVATAGEAYRFISFEQNWIRV